MVKKTLKRHLKKTKERHCKRQQKFKNHMKMEKEVFLYNIFNVMPIMTTMIIMATYE